MAQNKMETAIFQTKVYWCKLLGKPQPTYDGKNREWSIVAVLDKDGLKALQNFGIDRFYIKKGKTNKDGSANALTGKPTLKLDRKAIRKDGSAANPIPVFDQNGDEWDGALIGNESVCNIKITKYKVELPGQPARWKPYLLEMQVWDHVPYEGSDGSHGFPTKGEPRKTATKTSEDDWDFGDTTNHQKDVDFDDEIPF